MTEFKLGEIVEVILPDSRKIDATYLHSSNGGYHYVLCDTLKSVSDDGNLEYEKKHYKIKGKYIKKKYDADSNQYKSWLKMAIILEQRIDDCEEKLDIAVHEDNIQYMDMFSRKLERNSRKLSQIKQKITEYEYAIL